jgi:Rod binding domain-containing protein
MDSIKAMQILPNVAKQAQTGKTSPVSGRHTPEELKKIKKACADFEAIFTYELIKSMRKTVPEAKTGMNFGKDSYMMIIDQKLAENISNEGDGLGLQKMLFEQFTKINSPGR